MAVDVDGLPDSTAEIVRVLVQYIHIAPINAVLWLFGMLSHRGCGVARSFMLPYPGSESALRFTNIGRRTFLAVELVNNTRSVHSFDFILGGHKLLPDGVNWLVMGADALTLIDTGNSLRDTLDVGDYHTSFRRASVSVLCFLFICLFVVTDSEDPGNTALMYPFNSIGSRLIIEISRYMLSL